MYFSRNIPTMPDYRIRQKPTYSEKHQIQSDISDFIQEKALFRYFYKQKAKSKN